MPSSHTSTVMTWPCLAWLYPWTTMLNTLQKCIIEQQKYAFGTRHLSLLFPQTLLPVPRVHCSLLPTPLSIAGRVSPSSITLLISPRPQPPSVTCTLFLHCRFSLHSPISLPDSWRPLCCISHTESNAITVSARGARVPRWRSGTQQRPPSSWRGRRRQQPVRHSFSATPHRGFLSSSRATGWETEGAVNGKESHLCGCVCPRRPVEGGIPESQSWVTHRAQEISQKVGWSPDGQPEDGSITNSQVEKRPVVRAWTHTPRNAQKHTRRTKRRTYTWGENKGNQEKKTTFWAPECLHALLHSASVPTFMPSLPHEPPPCERVLRKPSKNAFVVAVQQG